MSQPMDDREARLRDLFCDAALVGLNPQEQAQLAQLLLETGRGAGSREEQSYERTVAAIALAGAAARPEPLAPMLAEKVAMRAFEMMGGAPASHVPQMNVAGPSYAPPSRMPSQMPAASQMAPVAQLPAAAKGPSRVVAIFGWVAAAACLLLAVGAIVKRPREIVVTKTVEVPASAPTIVAPPPPVPLATQRTALLAHAGTTTMEWSATKDPAATSAQGDVVWNAKEQNGFMRFHGLAKNDPGTTQYQLWIFDKSRDARYPVDGGVFDIDTENGDVIVPIHGRIPVGDASLFAVTIEKPGGVVVSKRERIVVTAKPTA